jgi:hypothetical protein
MLKELQVTLVQSPFSTCRTWRRQIGFVSSADARSPVLTGRRTISGDFIRKATLVPIPNTIVKLAEPMIVPKGVKVGHRRSLS